MLDNIKDIRDQFPILNRTVYSKPLVYFDNAATSQKPLSVIEAINKMNAQVNGNVHRAPHRLGIESTDMYENAREKVRKYINAKSREEIVFTSGATASLNLVAYSFAKAFFKKGDAVVISEAEHHSNIVPWQFARDEYGIEIKILPVAEDGRLKVEDLEKILDERVKLVSITQISNVLGIVNPVKEIVNIAHKHNIPVLIDGAQGIVHEEIDVQRDDIDFYVFSGHKFYGPTGIGVLYGKKSLLEQMPPWMGGGDMIESVTFEKSTYAELPLKFEAGTANYAGAVALGAAIDFAESLDKKFVNSHDEMIVDYLLLELQKIEGMKLYGNRREGKIPLFSFNVEGVHATDLAILLDKTGIALRSGMLCAEPFMRKAGANGVVRASLLVYNTIEEAEYFINSLKRAVNILSK